MVYPNSNLPSASQPWGKAIQRDLEKVQALVASNEVNNKARDTQLEKNYKRLDGTVNAIAAATLTAQNAANDAASAASQAQGAADTANAAVTDLANVVSGATAFNGSGIISGTFSADKITTGQLSANRIAAGTLTGFTVNTAASGPRVEMNGSYVKFVGSSESINGSVSAGSGGLYLSSNGNSVVGLGNNSLDLNATNSNRISVYNNQINMYGTAVMNSGFSSSANSSVSGTLNVSGALSTSGTLYSDSASVTNGVTIGGTTNHNGAIYYAGRVGSSTTGTPIHVRTSGANTNLLFEYTSSARYKDNITDLDIDYDSFTSIPVKSFYYKDDLAEFGDDAKPGYGFIAEDLHNAGYTDLVVYSEDEDGNLIPHSLAFNSIAAVTQSLVNKQADMIRELQATVQSLTDRIEALEGK